ncbi:MAG: restriction endonuclease [Chitinophagaceae bacterium]|jgi:restriction system protein|nr:restriction endonuclease [Chitinophagaceae bacterium]
MTENLEHLHLINIEAHISAGNKKRFVANIQHKGLNTFRTINDIDLDILEKKIDAQFEKWDAQFSRLEKKNREAEENWEKGNIAEERTQELQDRLNQIENILHDTLDINDAINWNKLKDKKKFKIPNPKIRLQDSLNLVSEIHNRRIRENPIEPNKNDYEPTLSFVDKLFKSKRERKVYQSKIMYETALAEWNKMLNNVNEFNNQIKDQIEKEKGEIIKKHDDSEREWERQKNEFEAKQAEHNLKVDKLKELYNSKDENAIIQYCELVLNNSEYPDEFPKDFDLEYNGDNHILVVEYVLPPTDVFPRHSEVKYNKAKKELREVPISELQFSKMYENALYSICLRTVHELYEADVVDAIDTIVFNGWVNELNKATGKKSNNCILSLQVRKEEFVSINLANIDVKVCFKNLKGVSASKLIGMTPIQPLIQINKSDKRFVSSYDVIDKLDEGSNLAIMDWEDFEHLLRELFEKEFSTNGGEVRVTQASRDGGVDAIAFDPDPIRGGKIVIQAKRYTNTVGVSSVRDLYGTVMNEGATKGILVTTSDFGPDAYEFVKNKPLTLLNGNNLLFLLEKHGRKARIDIAEAKRLQSGNTN